MAKKGERSLLLFVMLFAFMCLLLQGGGRLIAGEDENQIPLRQISSIRAVLCNAPQHRPHAGDPVIKSVVHRRVPIATVLDHQASDHCVPSDANGNVLAARTYMRAVYQAFALDDGFV